MILNPCQLRIDELELLNQTVVEFYRQDLSRVRASMILFNWFGVALIPIMLLIAERMRAMAHRTPVLRYCVIGVAGGAPIAFLTSTVFWLVAAFRPDRSPDLTLLTNDLAWITFTCGVPFLVALYLFIALAVAWDDQPRPVFPRWVAWFNLVIALVTWTYIGRIVRGQVLTLREREFVEASRALGETNSRIMFRELLPNLAAPIIVYSTLIIPSNILFEAALSFLGVGIPKSTPSLGRMLADASRGQLFTVAWWMMLYPGAFLVLLTLAFNLLGDGLRDALDPRGRRGG